MVEFDPFSESFFDDPFPSYRRLRDESPVHYVEEFDAWFISRFQDVWDAAGDERLSASGGMTSNELLLGQKLNSGENLRRRPPTSRRSTCSAPRARRCTPSPAACSAE